MKYLEMPGSTLYHYLREEHRVRSWCCCFGSSYVGEALDRYVVQERSDGRRVCKLCFGAARQAAKRGQVKLPGRSSWEAAQLEPPR